MVGGSRALRGILSCAVALTVTACADDSSEAEVPGSASSSTTATPPGPELETNTDDVAAAMRSLLKFDFWSEANPQEAEARFSDWLVPGSPFEARVADAIDDQLEKHLVPTGQPQILEIRAERVSATAATVLVWLKSEGYRFDGPPEHAFDSKPFERTLFVFELQRGSDGVWRIADRRITRQL